MSHHLHPRIHHDLGHVESASQKLTGIYLISGPWVFPSLLQLASTLVYAMSHARLMPPPVKARWIRSSQSTGRDAGVISKPF